MKVRRDGLAGHVHARFIVKDVAPLRTMTAMISEVCPTRWASCGMPTLGRALERRDCVDGCG